MNPKVKSVLDQVVEQFKSGNIPEPIAMAMFPIPDVPSSKWSFLNRTIIALSGTGDARGFRQWKQASRYVKKGSKAVYILVPYLAKKKGKADTNGDDDKEILIGFSAKPVFRVEDTDGEALDYQEIELPDLPLLEKAHAWGISVKAIPGNFSYYGYYAPSRKEIGLATPEEKTFFHELSHVGHQKVKGSLRAGQDPLQEIVAELSAQVLCHIVGRKQEDSTGNSYRYIENYSKKLKVEPFRACLKVLSEVEQVLSLILAPRAVLNGDTRAA